MALDAFNKDTIFMDKDLFWAFYFFNNFKEFLEPRRLFLMTNLYQNIISYVT